MILCFGEILCDTLTDEEKKKNTSFVGGAPFNVSYAAYQMGCKTLFVGNVGNDNYGKQIIKFFKDHDLDLKGLRVDSKRKTTISKVILKQGERDFTFERNDTADDVFDEDSLKFISQANIVHLGSLMLSSERGRAFFDKVVSTAKSQRKILSFDINFRSDIFKSKDEALKIYNEVYPQFDIVKFSLEELELFTGESSIEKALEKLNKGPKLILVTLGMRGSIGYAKGRITKAQSIKVHAVDTTGAGDAFLGTFLSNVESIGLGEMCFIPSLLESNLRFSNVAGALSTTKYGALSSMPDYMEVTKALEKQSTGEKPRRR